MNTNALQKTEQHHEVGHPESTQSVYFTPGVDILETDDELLLYADLPGVKAGDVDIRFENGELTLHGRVQPRWGQGEVLAAEYGVGDFYRVFTVAEGINPDKIAAELNQGVLTVHLPKSEAVKPRRIMVSGN